MFLKTKNKIFIGGEKLPMTEHINPFKNYHNIDINFNFYEHLKVYFTFGGYYSLKLILKNYKKLYKEFNILLPNYLCNSIIECVNSEKVGYYFYKIDSNLLPVFDSIVKSINPKTKIILFIDYFGRNNYHANPELFNRIKDLPLHIIQDAVHQTNFKEINIYGDFIYNSYRKICPYEGSILLSKMNLVIDEEDKSNNKFIFWKRLGQLFRILNIDFNVNTTKLFIACFHKADQVYINSSVIKMPALNRYLINKIDFSALRANQKKYYDLLDNYFLPYNVFKDCNVIDPLMYVIKTKSKAKIMVDSQKYNIFLPNIWNFPTDIDDPNMSNTSNNYDELLCIPLYQMSDSKVNFIVKFLKNYIS